MNPTRSAPCLMLTDLFASPVFAAPASKVSGKNGKIFSNENDTVVKKDMKIKRNHQTPCTRRFPNRTLCRRQRPF